MMSKILSVNISQNKGKIRHTSGSCPALSDKGLANEVHIVTSKRQKGFAVNFGDFAEYLKTAGIELFTLPLSTKSCSGKDVWLEGTEIGITCPEPCAIFCIVGDCTMPKEGIFSHVPDGGNISIGDKITSDHIL